MYICSGNNITPVTNANVKSNPNPNTNTNPNPNTIQNQKPNDNPCFYSVTGDIITFMSDCCRSKCWITTSVEW